MFELNGSTLVGIGAVLGALAGAISFLFKVVIEAKDAHLKDKDLHISTLMDRIVGLAEDRDYWRDVALGRTATDKAAWIQQRPPRPRAVRE